jgi:hypothetical protein
VSKQKKGNREAKKTKKKSDGTKKEKKDPNRHDDPVARVLKSSNEKRNIEPKT